MAIPILTAKQMQDIDAQTIDQIGIPGAVLMEQAGRACAEEVENLLSHEQSARVAVICGKGNNGGDGLVAARYLAFAGHQVEVFALTEPAQYRGDARQNLQIYQNLGLSLSLLVDEQSIAGLDLANYDVVLDAIFGTGLSKSISGRYRQLIDKINKCTKPVLAVDIPSGLSADSGQIMGVCVQAAATVTFGAPKRGHLLYPGAESVGDLTVVDIGFPPHLFGESGCGWLLTDDDMSAYLPKSPADVHKGNFGHLLVVAGSRNTPGAAGLCCQAACRSGAGLVTLGSTQQVLDRIVTSVEFMGVPVFDWNSLRQALSGKTALALGPGLGNDAAVQTMVQQAVIEVDLPMVVDADGLNHLVGMLTTLKQAARPRVLTPHPGEMARLLDVSSTEVQADRFYACERLAELTQCVVVLKGARTLICDTSQTFMVPTGNPGMASGGSGDVLTGMIGSLLAQGLDPTEAACVGAYVHGAVGDWAQRSKGQRAQIARDLITHIPDVMRRIEGDGDQTAHQSEP